MGEGEGEGDGERERRGEVKGSDLEDFGDSFDLDLELPLLDLSIDLDADPERAGLSSDLWHGGSGGFDSKLDMSKMKKKCISYYLLYLLIQ